MIFIKLFCFAASAVGVNEVSAMQLQTLLHSGCEGHSPYLGVTVTNGGVQDEDMLRVLRAESHMQFYRYLHEAGIIRMQIMPLGSTFSLKRVSTPTESDIEAAVRELKATLDSLGVHLIKSVDDAVSYTIGLRPTQKIDAVRRFVDTNTLLKNLNTLEKRFLGLYDVGYKNLQRTRREEVDAVFQQIFQEYRPVDEIDTRWPFKFHGTYFDFTKEPLIYAKRIPLTLTVPLDQASDYSILNFVLKDGQINRARMRDLLNRLQRKYLQQILNYSIFLDIPYLPPAIHYIRDLTSSVKRVQNTRRRALELYDRFRLPFPSQVNPLFYIYMHDPEGRASLATGGKPFFTMFEAAQFADKVILSFERVPRFYYSGLLRSVVLFDCGNCSPGLLGRVTADGSEMQLWDLKFPVFAVYDTVLHESSHVYDSKSGKMLQNNLARVVSPRYSPQIHLYLKEVEKYFFELPGGFTNNNHDIERLSIITGRLLNFIQHGRKDTSGASLRNGYQQLSQDDKLLLTTLRDSGPLLAERKVGCASFHECMAGEDLSEFTSFYAAENVAEEAAELLRHLADPTKRAALASEGQQNAIKRKKASLAFDVLGRSHLLLGETQSDMDERLVMAQKMRTLFSLSLRPSVSPERFAVVLVMDPQAASFDMFDDANAYVRGKLEEGHRVSFFVATRYDPYVLGIQVWQKALNPPGTRYDQPANVVIYGTHELDLHTFPQFESALASKGLDFDGRPRIPNQSDMPPMIHYPGCIRISMDAPL